MERPHGAPASCGRFACILHALLPLSPGCTTKRPAFRFLTETRLHRIVLNIGYNLGEMPRIPNVTIEVFFLPESTFPIKHPVSLI